MKVYAETDIGQKRQMNQDFVFASEEPIGNLPNLFVVADGMGGHNAGDFASRYGVSVLLETIKQDKNYNPVKILRLGMEAANDLVLGQAQKDPEMMGMGTTMVAATIVGQYVYVANVGDSRLYIAGDALTQITKDHSLVAEMVRIGQITDEEALNHPDRNIITRAIGTGKEVDIDFFDVKLDKGDRLVMCSDGLTNMVKEEVILETVRRSGENSAHRLVEIANANGGKDNITVIVVEPFTDDEVREEC